ncbi:MAG: hypothetical protein AAB817_01675, partial [Patescibacteria group bacterium]
MHQLLSWWKKRTAQLQPWRGLLGVTVITAVIMGFAAGLVGELFARGVILPYVVSDARVSELNNTLYTLLAKYNFLNQAEQSGPLELVIRRGSNEPTVTVPVQVAAGAIRDQLASAGATLFAAAPASDDPLLAAYLPADQLGR